MRSDDVVKGFEVSKGEYIELEPEEFDAIALETHDQHHLALIASPKRVGVAINGKTVADSLCAGLLLESERFPSTIFRAKNVRRDLIEPTNLRTHRHHKGEASYWTLTVGNRCYDDALWSYRLRWRHAFLMDRQGRTGDLSRRRIGWRGG